MQSAHGNQGMLRVVSGGALQRKLTINQPGDAYEREADRVADAVIRMPDSGAFNLVNTVSPVASIRRACGRGGSGGATGECEECKAKSMHMKEASAGSPVTASAGAVAPPIVHDVLRSPSRPLDAPTRSFMEPRFGHTFGSIRVHTGDRAAESARAVNALAYTVGRDVVFGAGQYAPQTQAGRRLLAHELAHTVQNPCPVVVSPFLEVGQVDDPAERAADRTADAVMHGEQASVSPAGGAVLRRQHRTCKASETDRADQRIVHCDDGDYRVTMTTSSSPPRPETRTSVSAGWNDTNIFLNIDVCRGGTSVRIRPTVDLPRAVGQALGNVLAGSGALTGANLSPGLEITIIQSDSFTLTLGPRVTVGQRGVTGGGLSTTVQTPDVTVRGEATYDAPSRTGFLTFTISGGSPQQSVNCHAQGHAYLTFQCERITHVPRVPEAQELAVQDTEVRYMFFDYPTANIRRNFRLPTDIQSLYDQGYRVTSIEGFTSPEGPRKRETPSFEGNIALGQERADAALTWLRKEACPDCDLSGVTPRGRSELPPQVGAAVPEAKGRGMERAAVEEFLGAGPGQRPDPLAPHDPAELAAFHQLPGSLQRERAFELMRRAAITLQHRRVVQEYRPEVPARDDFNAVTCDRDVIDAARASFGITLATGATPLH
jgi:Domain of unknown function (DUF4157)